ncbi:MAG TPA: phosphodiester glycosidase family protein [Bacilli bacterium]|nr:phosphodiester glycosidase family protein [Bacilli bacterium]
MNKDIEILNIEAVENTSNKAKIKNEKRKLKLGKYTKFLLVIDAIAIICFFLVYGPINYFREYIVTHSIKSMSHQYFAYVFYNNSIIDKVIEENKVIESGDSTDTSAIKITEVEDQDTYESIYEEQILKKDEGNDLYKIITIKESSYTAYISVIYDPSRVEVASAKRLSSGGQYTTTIAKANNAIIAINGGGFSYSGSVMRPKGVYIEDGKIIYNKAGNRKLIAMTKDNILLLTNTTAENALTQGVEDAVEFGPFLIVNGVAAEFKGDGGYGNRPRTAIGQRQDGIILFVTVDGKRGLYGTTLKELTNIFVRYKAYNAANLDGGGSTALVINGTLKNEPISWNHGGERPVCNAWMLK